MELTAKLVQVLPLQTGQGKNGEWKKQDIIVETDGQYPKKVCISVWGDKIDENQLQIGNQLNISFDVESREYNGRWYTDCKAWKVASAGGGGGNAGNANSQSYDDREPYPSQSPSSTPEDHDDLPF
ncbi:MAG: DUF3127 domain-containing protein [Bacteroidia bacterium]